VKNLVLYIKFNLVDKSFADVFGRAFSYFVGIRKGAKMLLNTYCLKAQGFYLR
jgi:hypothetical protein